MTMNERPVTPADPDARDARSPRPTPYPLRPTIPDEMDAWVVARPGPIASGPLERVRRPVPEPGPGEVLVAGRGVRRLPYRPAPRRGRPAAARGRRTVPGHEVVGRVIAAGPGAARLRAGQPGGRAPGCAAPAAHCRYCRAGRGESLPRIRLHRLGRRRRLRRVRSSSPRTTPTPCPRRSPTSELAPLLCAGIIGYRALRRGALPPGGRLGIYGFGASAHLTAQVAHRPGRDGPRAVPGPPRPSELALDARRGLGRRRLRRAARSRWTPRSCSPRSATWSRSRWPPSTGAGPSPSPASTSATSRR